MHRYYVVFLLVVSSFGLLVTASMWGQPVGTVGEFGGRKIVVASVYGFVCLAGMLVAFFPQPCSRAWGIHRPEDEYFNRLDARASRVFGILLIHGHHPLTQQRSAAHELRVRGKSFCATCFGLIAGAITSLIIMAVYIFSGWTDTYAAHFLYVSGVGGVVLGFIPVLIGIGARMKFILGAVFVIGTCLILIGEDVAATNLAADLVVILLAIFWLLSRMSFSHQDWTMKVRTGST